MISPQPSNQASYTSNAPLLPSINVSQFDVEEPFQPMSRANLSRMEWMERELHSRTNVDIAAEDLAEGEGSSLVTGSE